MSTLQSNRRQRFQRRKYSGYPGYKPRLLSLGFTLFEVILAIALSATLLALIGTAIHFFLFSTESSRSEVERAQLARAILQSIASDIRSAIRCQPQDTSTAMMLAEEVEAFDADSLDTLSPNEPSASIQDIAGMAELPRTPGVYGNENELQVDISRVPRLDEYEAMLNGVDGQMVDRPSDIKTVAYYLRTGTAIAGNSLSATRIREDRHTAAGLIRRKLDRATTQWAVDTGDTTLLDMRGRLFAPEVVGLQFQFFNGDEWVAYWDSDEEGGLPVAVHVRIWLRREEIDEQDTTSMMAYTSQPTDDATMYELIVHLPNAEPTSENSSGTGAVSVGH